jgi:membrane protein DedA with SNARE-associated domain
MSSVSFKKFILLNAAGALVWAVAVASGGFLFGRALEVFIGKLKSYEIYIMGSVAIVGLLVWIFHFYRRRRRRAKLIAKSG